MTRWRTDAETVRRRAIIGDYHDDFGGVEHALAALSRGDTTPLPEVADRE